MEFRRDDIADDTWDESAAWEGHPGPMECMYILSTVEIIDAGRISTETLVVPVDLSGCNES